MNTSGKRAILVLSIFLPAVLVASASPCPMETRSFEFTYSMRVTDLPERIGKIAIWLPYPVSDANQSISEVSVSAPFSTSIHRDPAFQNSILYLSAEDPEVSSIEIEMVFRVNRKEFLRKDFSAGRPAGSEKLSPEVARWLEPDRLVPLDDFIRALAEKVTEGKSTDLEKARAIYDYAVTSMAYDKSGEGWGRGDIYYACNFKKGNCTDFHALFIGLARSVGIPAKFAVGFPLPEKRGSGQIGGYHCWSEFYLQGYGWVPVDASEANKHPELHEYFFGAHDENRVQFTIGRDLVLEPPQDGDAINYFIYPHVEVDGKPFRQVEQRFEFRDLKIGS